MKIYRLPLLSGLAHGASDAAAGLLVGLIIQQNSPWVNALILLYNLLAFGLQPLAGILFDHTRQPKQGLSASLLITASGVLLLRANLNIAIILIGLGSAGLHAGGGALAIKSTPGKASAPGVFAAFGVVGLALGGLASLNFSMTTSALMAMALVILMICLWFWPQPSTPEAEQAKTALPAAGLALLIVLVGAIALRSTVWVGMQSDVARYSSAALGVALAAGMGKLLGGFAADRVGWLRWMLASMAGAALMFIFASPWLPGLMLGAFLLQSVTPLSIAAAGRALPNSPALAASLALGFALIAGGLPFFVIAGNWFGTGTMAVTLCASILLYWRVLRQGTVFVEFSRGDHP